ncbi:hypothetical protein KIW84_076902 [Lathyrus oleraceus]|uniref:Transposase (putative) gypsy type domain-containing protein n=1 Tax=Pisum sativum TaxID=3888 RepID=A0A9D4VZ17_PEA|nr:hypothetical protein KIW84_076902 [Pisum sativum]
MDTSGDPSLLYFYLHLLVIYELWVLVPFSYFETKFLNTINVPPLHFTPNAWGILRGFQIICCNLGVSPSVRVLLYFYMTKFLPSSSWVMLCPFPEVCLLEPFASSYEDRKDKFVRIRGKDNTYHVTLERETSLCLPYLGICETSRAADIRPPKIPRREVISSAPSGNQEVRLRTKILMGAPTPSKPSLCNDPAFEVVPFADHFLSFFHELLM